MRKCHHASPYKDVLVFRAQAGVMRTALDAGLSAERD